MEKLKKLISVLLVGVIAVTSLFCGAVTVGAEDKKFADPLFRIKLTKKDYIGFMISYDYEVYKYYSELQKNSSTSDVVLAFEFAVSNYSFFTNNIGEYINYYVYNSKTNTKVSIDDYTFKQYSESINNTNYKSNYFWFKKDSPVGKAILSEYKDKTLIPIHYQYVLYSLKNSKTYYGSEYTRYHNFITLIDETAPKDISTLTFSKISNQSYTGEEIRPSITVKDGSKTLVKGKDYSLLYEDNEDIGTATLTIYGEGDYTGEKVITFKIVPPTTKLSAKKSSNGYKLSWKAVDDITKYQIQYSADGGKTYKNAGNVSSSKTSCSLKLDTSKSYTFRMRSYKTVDGKKYYSSWSKTVTVKK